MTIPKKQIAKLIRTSTTTPTKSTQAGANLLSKQQAPPQHAELAKQFRKLISDRNTVWDAQYMMALHDREIARLEIKLKEINIQMNTLDAQLTEIAIKISEIKLPETKPRNYREVEHYNKLVTVRGTLSTEHAQIYALINPLKNEAIETANKIEELHREITVRMKPVPDYHKNLNHFSAHYADYVKLQIPSAEDDESKRFFDKIDRYLSKFKNEISQVNIDTWKKGNTTFVRALINGKTSGVFIFDTGASTMTISHPFAKKLGFNIDQLPKNSATVADGRVVETRTALLESVVVGGVEIKNVEVAILSDEPGQETDGLLGMSFLRHFTIGINGATGEIELTKFNSNP